MNKHNRRCISISELNRYETRFFSKLYRLTGESFIELIDKHAASVRFRYCNYHCEARERCKFQDRYRK